MSSMLCGIMALFYNEIHLLDTERPPSAENFESLVVEMNKDAAKINSKPKRKCWLTMITIFIFVP